MVPVTPRVDSIALSRIVYRMIFVALWEVIGQNINEFLRLSIIGVLYFIEEFWTK